MNGGDLRGNKCLKTVLCELATTVLSSDVVQWQCGHVELVQLVLNPAAAERIDRPGEAMPQMPLKGLGKLPSLDALRSSVDSIQRHVPFGNGGRGESSEFRVGTVVILKSTPYKIVGEIASGAYSQVFRCVDRDGNEYALKRTVCRSLEQRAASDRELRILAALPSAHGLVQFSGSVVRQAGKATSAGTGTEVFALLTLCRGGNLADNQVI